MTRKRGMATAFAAACLVLAGCAGPLNLMQESIYCDDARIAQGFDTYTVANRTGSLFDRKIGGPAWKHGFGSPSPTKAGSFASTTMRPYRTATSRSYSSMRRTLIPSAKERLAEAASSRSTGESTPSKPSGRMRVPKSPSNCKRAKASPPLPRVTRSTTTRQWISNRLKADAADLPAWTRMRFHKKRTTA